MYSIDPHKKRGSSRGASLTINTYINYCIMSIFTNVKL